MTVAFLEPGFRLCDVALDRATVEALVAALPPTATQSPEGGRRAGARSLLQRCAAVRELARHPSVRAVAEGALGAHCFAVRGLLFDKSPAANWRVAWHQDLAIALQERRAAPGFSGWSEKDGIPHAIPPVAVLERMLAVRVHLDDCGPENGPLLVIPGSHVSGILRRDEIDSLRARGPVVECIVAQGGLLAFRPLLLHASAPATRPSRRRVVHLEFAAGELTGGLEWHCRA
ncbi:MAG: phytanoyl-CoA dioxygenase family protein [Planctomycetes bacterium]|nr:phytanoyl-CoA dioxygenase family protein [Planctomycetota bacterium]